MRIHTSLPGTLTPTGFRVADAAALGVSMSRLRSRDLVAPFHGIRASRALVLGAAGMAGTAETAAAASLRAQATAFAARMPAQAYFSHETAALLYGAPLPREHESGPLHVSIAAPMRASQRAGVSWHQSATQPPLRTHGPLRAASPATVWCQLAQILSVNDLVAVGDYFVTGIRPLRPDSSALASLAELEEAVQAHGSRRGIRALKMALPLVRYGPLSRPESLTRLLLTQAGLPEPRLNYTVQHPQRRKRYMLDLAYPEHSLGLDYEGDYHRTDKAQFRSDIRRVEELAEFGWRDIRVTADDLSRYSDDLVERVRAHLARPQQSQRT